jgi:hypothetical protein
LVVLREEPKETLTGFFLNGLEDVSDVDEGGIGEEGGKDEITGLFQILGFVDKDVADRVKQIHAGQGLVEDLFAYLEGKTTLALIIGEFEMRKVVVPTDLEDEGVEGADVRETFEADGLKTGTYLVLDADVEGGEEELVGLEHVVEDTVADETEEEGGLAVAKDGLYDDLTGGAG